MNEEIETIKFPELSLSLQELYDADVEWLRVRSGINLDLLGEADDPGHRDKETQATRSEPT